MLKFSDIEKYTIVRGPAEEERAAGVIGLVGARADGTMVLPDGSSPVSGGGAVAANTTVGMGHSRIAFAGPRTSGVNIWIDKYGLLTAINELLGGRLQIVANLAVTGTTFSSVISVQLPLFNAINPAPKYVVMEIGYNDWSAGVTAAQGIASWNTIYQAIVARGSTLIAMTDQAGGTLTAQQRVHQQIFNSWLRQAQSSLPNLVVVDAYAATLGTIVDSSAGALFSTLRQSDAIHPNCSGAYAIAREAFPVLDPLIPRRTVLAGGTGPFAQMAPNPYCDTTTAGGNASGANGWTAGAGITGVGPDNWNALRTTGAAATAVTSIVARSASTLAASNRRGNLLQIDLVQGAVATDAIAVRPHTSSSAAIGVRAWASNTARVPGVRIRPTVPNGVHYAVMNTGASATGADPTAGWSTTIGATVTDGSMTLTVVPAIDVGDTVVATAEVYGGAMTGAYGAYLKMVVLDTGFGVLRNVYGSYFDASSGGTPSYGSGLMVLKTPEIVLPENAAIINLGIEFIGSATATWSVQIGAFGLQKVGA